MSISTLFTTHTLLMLNTSDSTIDRDSRKRGMNVSETEKLLTDAYYWLSMYKAGTVPEDLALEQVKGALLDQPQLNQNQQIVLEKLKRLLVDYDVYNANPFETIYCFVDDYGTEKYYENLTAKQEVQVLQVFIQWALEQEE